MSPTDREEHLPLVSRGEKHTSCGKEVLYVGRRAPASPRGESSLRTHRVLAQKGLSVSSYIGGWPHSVTRRDVKQCKARVFRATPLVSIARERSDSFSPEALQKKERERALTKVLYTQRERLSALVGTKLAGFPRQFHVRRGKYLFRSKKERILYHFCVIAIR